MRTTVARKAISLRILVGILVLICIATAVPTATAQVPLQGDGAWRGWVLFTNLSEKYQTRDPTYGDLEVVKLHNVSHGFWVDVDPDGFDAFWSERFHYQHSGYDPDCPAAYIDSDVEPDLVYGPGIVVSGPATWSFGWVTPSEVGTRLDPEFMDPHLDPYESLVGLRLTSAPTTQMEVEHRQRWDCGSIPEGYRSMLDRAPQLLKVAAGAHLPEAPERPTYLFQEYHGTAYGDWTQEDFDDEGVDDWLVSGAVVVCMTKDPTDADGDGLPDEVDQEAKVAGPIGKLGMNDELYGGKYGVGLFCPLASRGGEVGSEGTSPQGVGNLGATCGKTKFAWFLNTQRATFVKKGEQACSLLLSNAFAREALRVAYTDNKSLTEVFGGEMLDMLSLDDIVEEIVKSELESKGWELGATIFPRTARFVKFIGFLGQLEELSKYNAIVLHTLWVINTILHENACVQLNLDADGDELKLNWHLVYSPSSLEDPTADKRLTIASVWDREERGLRTDVFHRRKMNLSCTANGLVETRGVGVRDTERIFTTPVSISVQ